MSIYCNLTHHNLPPHYTVSQPRRPRFGSSSPWKPQISKLLLRHGRPKGQEIRGKPPCVHVTSLKFLLDVCALVINTSVMHLWTLLNEHPPYNHQLSICGRQIISLRSMLWFHITCLLRARHVNSYYEWPPPPATSAVLPHASSHSLHLLLTSIKKSRNDAVE